MQANWIGRSEGARSTSRTHRRHRRADGRDGSLKVFTTRADTLFGVTYMAIAAEHPLALAAARQSRVAGLHRRVPRGSTMEADVATMEKKRPAHRLACATIRSPASRVPVWVANYVLMGYGEGAVMGVPAHDERDFAFANATACRHEVVIREPADGTTSATWIERGYSATTASLINSGPFDGLGSRRRLRRDRAALEGEGLGRRACSSACATGASRASATGAARSR
jgi:leucyl-tRNA synthetase